MLADNLDDLKDELNDLKADVDKKSKQNRMMQMVMLQNLDQKSQAGSSAAMEQRLQQVEAINEALVKTTERRLLDVIGAIGEQVMSLKTELFAAVGIY